MNTTGLGWKSCKWGLRIELVYLPSYSPDYNPMKEAFSKLKELLRRVAAHNGRLC